MKKVSFLLLVVLLVEVLASTSVYASNKLPPDGDLRYNLIGNLSCYISISGDSAALSARVSAGSSDVTDSEMTLELQEKVALFWITRATWTQSSHSSNLSMNEQYPVESGKTYRAKVSATLYTSGSSETATKTATP